MEYDFRTRFQVGLNIIGRSMSIGEAARLVTLIAADPSSMTAAAAQGWDYAPNRTELLLADMYDLLQATGGVKRPKAHPMRPWKKRDERRHGSPRPMREMGRILNRFGHKLPV